LEQFHIAHSYKLPAEFPGKTGQGRTQYITELTARDTTYWPKAWQLQTEVHTCWRKYGRGGAADTRPRRMVTHQISRDVSISGISISDIDIDGSLPVLCTGYHMPRSWAEGMPYATAEWKQPPCIHHNRFVVVKKPWYHSNWRAPWKNRISSTTMKLRNHS